MSKVISEDVERLKTHLEGWKLVLIPINNLLEWEKKYDPLIIVALNSLVFGLLKYYNPSILTTVSLICLSILLLEAIVPLINSYFLKNTEWDQVSESKFTRICERINNFCLHFKNFNNKLQNIRKEKQSLYFLVVFFFLIFCVYLGQSVDNFLLTYLAGARRRNLFNNLSQKLKISIGMNKATHIASTRQRIEGDNQLLARSVNSNYEYSKRK